MADEVDIQELEELRTFLEEVLARFDPSIDTSQGSSADVNVITPILDRLSPDPYATDIEAFIRARLRSEFPNLSVGAGEPIDDYVIKPLRVILAPYRRVINQIKQQQSFNNAELMSDEEADNLGANFFTERSQGGFSVGIARLYFSSPQVVTVTPNNPVFTSAGTQFFPVQTQSIRPDNMIFNTEGNLYYFDIVVRSENTGDDTNIDAGELVGIEGITNVVKVTNKAKFAGGGTTEDTETYLARLEESLTEKSLVTARGILARLFDVFDSIKSVSVIGYGDPEMNRDIVSGSGQPVVYAYLTAAVQSGAQDTLELTTINDGDSDHSTFFDAGVAVGDTVSFNDTSTPAIHTATVTEVVSGTVLKMSPNLPVQASPVAQYTLAKPNGLLTISGIPGGILDTDTPAGEIVIEGGEIHIGGQVDVYVRGEDPAEQSINLTSIRDAQPLHFGLDLESFGEEEDEYIQVTRPITSAVWPKLLDLDLNVVNDRLAIRARNSDYAPWEPTEEDVGRYIQLLGPTYYGTYEILAIDGIYSQTVSTTEDVPTVLIQISLTNEDDGTTLTLTDTGDYTESFRIREKVSAADRVRDRDASRTPAGVDFGGLGVEIGDSVVIEFGDDAGTYSVRRILSSLDDDDTLILDRGLTKTVEPSGVGDSSGLRYRINDELDVDLIEPKVTKIPLGGIFVGDDLFTVAGSTTVSAGGSTNFLLAGVAEGDTLEILEGDNEGKYIIRSVTGTSLVLTTPVQATASGIDFSVYQEFSGVDRPLVRVKDIELLDSANQPTGISIPYGDVVDVRVSSRLSNRAEGKSVESYGGYISDYTTNRIYEAEYDFSAKGVLPEDRLTIFTTANAGDYTIKAIGDTGGGAPYWLDVYSAAEGGRDFRTNTSAIYYQTGVASAGFARFFFVSPTSIEALTGITGARLQYGEGDSARQFRLSEVEGKIILPAPGSEDENPRDLRVVRSFNDTSDYSILEFTDPASPDMFGIEAEVGDLVEVYHQIHPMLVQSMVGTQTWNGTTTIATTSTSYVTVGDRIRLDSDGQWFEVTGLVFNTSITITNPLGLTIPTGASGSSSAGTPESRAIFDSLAGLTTVVGSSTVTIPSNSLIDFEATNAVSPLVGQTIFIEEGPDSGSYVIEEVVDSKTLRLGAVMTSSTQAILGRDSTTTRDATLEFGSPATETIMKDSTDYGGFGTLIGHYITIFENTSPGNVAVNGTHEIKEIAPATDPLHPITLDLELTYEITGPGTPFSSGTGNSFSWIRTAGNESVFRRFNIYESVATQYQVTEVTSKEPDIISGVRTGSIPNTTTLVDGTGFAGVTAGDRLEILDGDARGVYTIETVGGTSITVYSAHPFPVVGSSIPYRIRGGIHGSRRTLTVGSYEGGPGIVEPGYMMPYVIRRPGVFRLSSTEMEDNFDGSLYYAEVQIESDGAGDNLNLDEDERLTQVSGINVDGYTYVVENNNLTFSPYEQVGLNFERRFLPVGNSDAPENMSEISGRNIKISYETSTLVNLVNELLRSETERAVTASMIGRHFLPSYVYFTMIYRGGEEQAVVGQAVEDFINNLGATEELEISDLEAFATRKGANSIQHPLLLVSVTHDIDRNLVVERSDNAIGGTTVPYNGSARTSTYFAILGEGLNVVREA